MHYRDNNFFFTHDENDEKLPVVYLSNWINPGANYYNFVNFFYYNENKLESYPASFFVEENRTIPSFLDNIIDSKINVKSILPKISEDLTEDFLVFENYIHVSRFSFIHFFVNNFIDVPICFKKSKFFFFVSNAFL